MAMYGSGNFRGCCRAHFGWDRINFLKVATMELHFAFVLESVLNYRDVFVTAGQGLHKAKAFAVPCPPWNWEGTQIFHSVWHSTVHSV